MKSQRLDVRLDPERQKRLRALAAQYHTPISDVVRRLIDGAYEETMRERRLRIVEELSQMAVESMPDPDELSRQLEATYEPGGID